MHNRPKRQMLKKLLPACALLALMLTAFFIYAAITHNRMVAQNAAYLEFETTQTADRINEMLHNARTSLETIASLYSQALDSPEVDLADLQEIAAGSSAFDYIEFVSSAGEDLSSTGGSADLSDREYFKRGMNGESGIDVVFQSRITHETLVVFYAPLKYDDRIIGVLLGMYREARMRELIGADFFGHPSTCLLCLQDGTLISSSRVNSNVSNVMEIFQDNNTLNTTSFARFRSALENLEAHSFTFNGVSGTGSACMAVLPETNWMLLQTFPSSVTSSMVNEANISVIAFGIVLVLCFCLYILFFLRDYRRALNQRKVELHYWEQLFNLLTVNTNDIFVLFSPTTFQAEYISPNLRDGLGLEPEDVTSDVRNIFRTATDGKSTLTEARLSSVKNGDSWKTNRQIRHNKTGELRWYLETLYRIEFLNTDNFVLMLSDRTIEHRANMNLAQALEVAKNANQAKSAFLSSVSHDIRTPMNAILGFSSLLEKDADSPEKVRQYTQKIAASGQHLLGLIDDVLDMSKIESGRTSLNISRFDLSELLENLSSIILPQARAKKQSFRILTLGLLPQYLCGDKLRVNQILLNLLSNAVKYTQESGSIDLTVRLLEQADQHARLQFTVKDNGFGMSEEYLKTIYDPFTREVTPATSKIQGTGLGMAITKNFVDLMEGDIQVESAPSKGSTFIVELSFELPAEQTDTRFWKDHGLSRILIAAENRDTLAEIHQLADQAGIDLVCAGSGREALENIKNARAEQREFQIVILDWLILQPPGRMELLSEIREAAGAAPYIFLLTGYDWSSIEDEARSAGVTHFLPRPFFVSSMQNYLKTIFEPKAGSGQDGEPRLLQGRRFLAAEDNELNSEILSEILALQGARCDIADNGRRALEMFEGSPAGYYDMILMDVQMPEMNGYEAAAAIRKCTHPDAESIPIIAMTANAFAEDVQKALDSGMNAHIAKPINMEEACKTLKEHLR